MYIEGERKINLASPEQHGLELNRGERVEIGWLNRKGSQTIQEDTIKTRGQETGGGEQSGRF